MSNLAKHLMQGATTSSTTAIVEDNFSTYLYEGNSSTQTITNNIDLATDGGMVWIKDRDTAYNHILSDTERGVTNKLYSNTTDTESTYSGAITGFNTDGFTIGDYTLINGSGDDFVSWTFKKASNFFDVQTATLGTGNTVVSFPDLTILGMVAVKRTDSTGSWYVWHRSATSGDLLYLEQTAAETLDGSITVSGTDVTLVDGTLADGDYVVYAWSHDTSEDGMIQCGSYTGNGLADGPEVNLGWEPQWVLIKSATSIIEWQLVDSMRGINTSDTIILEPDTTSAEKNTGNSRIQLTPTGFKLLLNTNEMNSPSDTYIYIAIRRPMATPSISSEVFAIATRDGTTLPSHTTTFPVDFLIQSYTTSSNVDVSARLIQGNLLKANNTNAESADSQYQFDYMDGAIERTGINTADYAWMWKRATGFFDVVCYTGTGVAHAEDHQLGVVPEMIWIKCRNDIFNWVVYHKDTGNNYFNILNLPNAKISTANIWNSTSPTDSQFTIGTTDEVNKLSSDFIAFLFATLAGISKVGSYTGNGTTQTINCGFSAGSKFVLIKRTDSTSNWNMFDSTRGIIAGNSPRLELNTTDVEDTGDDGLDPDNSGFSVNYIATNDDDVNVSGATYIYYAISA